MVVIKKKKNFSSDVLSTVRHHHPVPTDRPEYKQFLDFSVMLVVKISSITTGCFKKNFTLLGNQTLGTSYSETTNLLDLKPWQQEVLMSTPCCQSLRSNRLVVS